MSAITLQQRAASVVAVVVLLGVVAWLVSLASSAYQENGSVGPRPRLNVEWAILKWWIGDSAVIGKLFAGLLLVLSVGSQMLAKLHTKIWSLLGICLLCLGGTVAAVLFLIYGNDPALDIFKQFRSVAGGAPDALRSSISTALYATIAWLLSFMCVQLGISYKNAEGALKKLTD